MGDALRDMLSDAGSIPARSIKTEGAAMRHPLSLYLRNRTAKEECEARREFEFFILYIAYRYLRK